jgi:hypothetical protein
MKGDRNLLTDAEGQADTVMKGIRPTRILGVRKSMNLIHNPTLNSRVRNNRLIMP